MKGQAVPGIEDQPRAQLGKVVLSDTQQDALFVATIQPHQPAFHAAEAAVLIKAGRCRFELGQCLRL